MKLPRQRQPTGVHHDPRSLTRLRVAPLTELIDNLRLAGSGDADAIARMNAALSRAALRDSRLDLKPDDRRAQSPFESDRAAERALSTVNEYSRRLEGETKGRVRRA